MMKILAIDDNRDNLTTLRAVVLDRLPEIRVLTAMSGPEGLALALAEDPDVILLDIVMPELDGYAVCRKLKEDERLQTIPVLFLTAIRTDRESRFKALEAGAEGFLSKPFDEIELTAQIRSMAKIKGANRLRRLEKEQLIALVDERTRDLEKELAERKHLEEEISGQLEELQRWQQVMLGREDRVLELKQEVNDLVMRAGHPPRYPSAVEGTPSGGGRWIGIGQTDQNEEDPPR